MLAGIPFTVCNNGKMPAVHLRVQSPAIAAGAHVHTWFIHTESSML